MQSPSSILNFPHSPSEATMAKGEVASSGIATNLLYKLSGYVAYTSVAFTTAINTLTAGGTTEPESPTKKKSYNGGYFGDVMQINVDDSDGAYDDDEMSDGEMEYNEETNRKMGKKVDRKNEAKWAVNDDDEPPPPYDSSWVMPKNAESNSGANNLTDASPVPITASSSASRVENNPTPAPRDQQTTISQRRRQIRVRRPRRLLRRKSTETSIPKGVVKCEDPDEMLLKVNDRLSDMIEQARAALTSTVDVTEVDMLLAEEREREEKIMKELGLQIPVGRKGRKNTALADYEYFTSVSDGNYSSPESSYEYSSYGAYGSEFASPSGYEAPDAYLSHGHYNTQFPSSGAFNYANLGCSLSNHHNHHTYNNNNNKFGENDFTNQMPNRYYGPSSSSSGGFVDHTIPKGFGNGPVSGGFGRLRFGQNNSFGTNYGPGFASPNGGFGSNNFGQNGGGYETYRGFM